ncbi:sensor histidine kinase [Pseudotenacibaculum haliotis]|uniref:Histidine kinase n=1 Tax=Pseudotenacibaculum haliotis TaxID=1862138 RepID=A0ABW5LVP9_9FLAO
MHLSEKDGLPDIEFYNILEDSEGFIWLAADKGFFRYDGKEFKEFSHPLKRGRSVFNLQKDDKGRVWCNNISGQFFFAEKDSLHLFVDLMGKVDHDLLPEFIVSDNTLKVSTDVGLYFIDEKATVVRRKIKQQVKIRSTDILQKKEKLYFLYDSLTIFKGNRLQKEISLNGDYRYRRLFSINNRVYVCVSKNKANDNYEVPFSSKLLRVDGKINSYNYLPSDLKKKTIIEIVEIDNRVWFCTNSGLFIYRLENDTLVLEHKLFEDEYVTKVIRDKDNTYWITTLNNGIFIVPNIQVKKQDQPIKNQKVSSILTYKDRLLYGTYEGQIVFKNLINGDTSIVDLKEITGGIIALKLDSDNQQIYVDGMDKAFMWDIKSGNLNHVLHIKGYKWVNFLKNYKALISDYTGLYMKSMKYNDQASQKNVFPKKRYLQNKIEYITEKTLEHKRSYGSFYSSDGVIYALRSNSMGYYDRNSVFQEIKYKNKSLEVVDFAETDDGVIWLATHDKGVKGIKNYEVTYNYDTSNGILSNRASKILADGNDLWIVSGNELSFIDRNKNKISSFSLKDELGIQKIRELHIWKGMLYILGNNGEVISLSKGVLNQEVVSPEVYFSEVKIQGKKRTLDERYSLTYDENSLEINFNTNFFNSEENIKYYYRLKGLEKDWEINTTGNVRYPSLPYGDFTFQVRAINKKANSFGNVKEIDFYIDKPFWRTWWFTLSVASMIAFFFGLRLRALKKRQLVLIDKERLDKELIMSQLENLRSQMNPHFIFNALNSIQGYIVTNKKKDASIYLAEFSELIRMYLDFSKREEVSLGEELKALEIYVKLENVRFDNSLNYEIEHNCTDLNSIHIPSLFIQPYIENAIKHGLVQKEGLKKLLISFDFDLESKVLFCTIEDNGIGRENAMKLKKKKDRYHTSHAMTANTDRVDLLNRERERKISVSITDLKGDDHSPKGTRIVIQIPQ